VAARPCGVDTALDCSDQSLNSARPLLLNAQESRCLIMSGGLQELEHVYMKGMPFLQKPFTGTARRQVIKALLSPNPPLRTP